MVYRTGMARKKQNKEITIFYQIARQRKRLVYVVTTNEDTKPRSENKYVLCQQAEENAWCIQMVRIYA